MQGCFVNVRDPYLVIWYRRLWNVCNYKVPCVSRVLCFTREYLSCDNLMSNKQQFLVFHDSFEAIVTNLSEEIVCKNLELGTAHVIQCHYHNYKHSAILFNHMLLNPSFVTSSTTLFSVCNTTVVRILYVGQVSQKD